MSQSVKINVEIIFVQQVTVYIKWNYSYNMSADFSKMKPLAKWNHKKIPKWKL